MKITTIRQNGFIQLPILAWVGIFILSALIVGTGVVIISGKSPVEFLASISSQFIKESAPTEVEIIIEEESAPGPIQEELEKANQEIERLQQEKEAILKQAQQQAQSEAELKAIATLQKQIEDVQKRLAETQNKQTQAQKETTSSQQLSLLTNEQIVAKVKPAVVYIKTTEGAGSGFIIDTNGYILTNHHVIANSNSVDVWLLDGRIFSATIVGIDLSLDLAMLKINAINLPFLVLGSSGSNDLTQGDRVFTFGHPFGITLGRGDDVSFKEGTLSRRMRWRDGIEYLEISAEIHPGNSGGPLVNDFGEVVGINTFKAGDFDEKGNILGEALKFALPINIVKTIVPNLRAGKHASAVTIKRAGNSYDLHINNEGPNPIRINHLIFVRKNEKVSTTDSIFTESPDSSFHYRFSDDISNNRFKTLKGTELSSGKTVIIYVFGLGSHWMGIQYGPGSITDLKTGNDVVFNSFNF